MNSWRPYPLLRLVFPFVAGISAEGFTASVAGRFNWLIFCLLLLFLTSLIIPWLVTSYRLRWITGLAINCFMAMAGFAIATVNRPSNAPDYLDKLPDGLFVATLSEPPVTRTSGIKSFLKIRFYYQNGGWRGASGNAMGFLKFRTNPPSLKFGDHILLRAGFDRIPDNSNPNTFNYARYLANKGISHQVYAEFYDWKIINLKPSGWIRQKAYQVRDRLLDVLRENKVEGKEFAVAAALLLGYVDDLDADLRKDYAATGAMHILSVSGMHVGIIYIFLEFLLGFLNKSRSGRTAKAILLLVFIWFYAMITGLSPCVLRSAAMLSLPIIGKSMNRSPNMFNIIAASILFILAMEPFLILDVGFQLSYLAVTGIIILYKPVYDLYVTSAWLPDKIWSVVSVSIAAQIATLPITLYTFHQFPNYFMLTNIFVVPLSSFIIYVGILVLVAGNVPVICVLCAKLLIFLIWGLNSIIHLIEQLPFSTIQGVFISTPEMILLYLVIASGFLFLTLNRILYLHIFLVVCIFLNALFLDFQIQRLRSSRLIVYNARREALFTFSHQDRAILLYNGYAGKGGGSLKLINEMAYGGLIARGIKYRRDFWLGKGERSPELAKNFVPLIKVGNFIFFADSRIVILDHSIPKGITKQIKIDLLILSGNPKISLADAIATFHPAQIIVDATNSRYNILRWKKEATLLQVAFHAVTEQGAFEKEF
jgi:competence protein ComEC